MNGISKADSDQEKLLAGKKEDSKSKAGDG